MKINNVEELIDCLNKHKIVIYGVGYVATRFFDSLKSHGISQNVSCFVTTEGSDQNIEGKEILSIKDFENTDDALICIAVHESLRDEIIGVLEEKGLYNYIWIYPFQYELMLGIPIKRNIKVPLKWIVQNCFNDYRMAIRYLAIDHYYKKNDFGYDIYIQLEGLHCSEKTARVRLEKFIELIKKWEHNGYDEQKHISVFENYEIIDGNHRVSVASYFGQSYIMCNVFPGKKSLSEIHSQDMMLTKQIMVETGIQNEIVALLDRTNHRIREQFDE